MGTCLTIYVVAQCEARSRKDITVETRHAYGYISNTITEYMTEVTQNPILRRENRTTLPWFECEGLCMYIRTCPWQL